MDRHDHYRCRGVDARLALISLRFFLIAQEQCEIGQPFGAALVVARCQREQFLDIGASLSARVAEGEQVEGSAGEQDLAKEC